MNTPLHIERQELIRRLKLQEEALYIVWQEANIVGDYVMCSHIRELIEAVVFTYEMAEMPVKRQAPLVESSRPESQTTYEARDRMAYAMDPKRIADDRDGQGGGTE